MILRTTFNPDTETVRRAAVVGSKAERRFTEYITMLLIPVSCCVTITTRTAITAGRYLGWTMTLKMPMEVEAALGVWVG